MEAHANNAFWFLINTLLGLYLILLVLRPILSAVHADWHNTFSRLVHFVTEPLLRPFMLILPTRSNHLNWMCWLLAYGLGLFNIQVNLWIDHSVASFGQIAWWSFLRILSLLCNWYAFSILLQTIYRWISPGVYSPAVNLLWAINEPLLKPIRRILPKKNGLDFAPLLAIISLQVLNIFLPLKALFRVPILYL